MRTLDKVSIGLRIAGARVTRRDRPFFVQYSLLNGCNARCAYCNSPERDDHQLSTDEHKLILAELARLGTVRVKFLGGEPMLRQDLGELVDHVHGLGMRAAMVTNGFLVPSRMDLVRRFDEIVISIDGDEEAHDRQRGRGSWRRVMAAIEACNSERLDFFLSAVVTRRSIDQVDWLLNLARSLGVMVNFQVPQVNEEMYGPDAKSWVPEAEDMRAVLQRILDAKERGEPVLFSPRSYRHTLHWADYTVERDERPGERSPCTAGRYFIQVEPNGDIYPCVLQIGSFVPKNALRDGVEEAWRHAGRHSCFDCYNTWLNENRAIFDLHPSVLDNFRRNYLRPR